jgi:hypothetical protein
MTSTRVRSSLKPFSRARSSYRRGVTLRNSNAPLLPVLTVATTLPLLINSTVAPVSTAPDESLIVPVTDRPATRAVVDAQSTNRHTTVEWIRTRMGGDLPQSRWLSL